VNSRPRTFVLNVFVEMLLGDLPERAELVDPGIYRQHVDASGLPLDGCVDPVEVDEVGGIAWTAAASPPIEATALSSWD
jgi:hypothetical protein